MRRTVAGIAVCVVVLMLVGCSAAAGSDEHVAASPTTGVSAAPSPSPPDPTPARTADAGGSSGGLPDCASIVGIVTAVMKTKVTLHSHPVNGPVSACYLNVPGTVAIVRFQVNQSHAAYDSARAKFTSEGGTTTDIGGFGDEAYTATGTGLSDTIVALKGTTELLVTGVGGLDVCEAIAAKILPRM